MRDLLEKLKEVCDLSSIEYDFENIIEDLCDRSDVEITYPTYARHLGNFHRVIEFRPNYKLDRLYFNYFEHEGYQAQTTNKTHSKKINELINSIENGSFFRLILQCMIKFDEKDIDEILKAKKRLESIGYNTYLLMGSAFDIPTSKLKTIKDSNLKEYNEVYFVIISDSFEEPDLQDIVPGNIQKEFKEFIKTLSDSNSAKLINILSKAEWSK
jgi:hypothetical protein